MTHTTFTLDGLTVTITGPLAKRLADRITALQAQRVELLTALKEASAALAWFESVYGDGTDVPPGLGRIRAAIAKAEGGAA